MLAFCAFSTVNAADGKKYKTVYSQNCEDENTFAEYWTSEGSSITWLTNGEGEDANHYVSVKGTGNPNNAIFSFKDLVEVASLTDYEFSFVYGLCPSGASQGAEKNVFYYITRKGEETDTLFSIYSYRPSSASSSVNAEVRKKDGTVMATIPIGKRYLAFPDYLYNIVVKSSPTSGVTVSLKGITNGQTYLEEVKFAEEALQTDGFVLDNSNSGVTFSSLQVFDDIAMKVPTDEDVAETPTLFISSVLGAGRLVSAKAGAHENLHYAITADESVEGAEWDMLTGESEYELDQVETDSYVWAYTTYGEATSDTVMLFVECKELQLNPVVITRASETSNKVTLTANQSDILCKPIPAIIYTINDGEEQIAESKTSISFEITEDSKIVAWASDLDGCYLESEKTTETYTFYVAPEYKPSEYTVYHWQSDNGTVTEYGGTISYENGDGSSRLNVTTGGYYTITINGKKGNIDDAASANAGHMDIKLKDGATFKAGDIITMTACKNNGDASKLATPFFRFQPSGTTFSNDVVNWGDVKISGQKPTTETFIVPEGVDGDNILQISRSKAGTNMFIVVLDIAHPDPTGIVDVETMNAPNGAIYDVIGRKVNTLVPGLYIQKGKKFVIK